MRYLAALLLFALPIAGEAKHAPLPARLLSAKSIFIDNHASASIADRAYDELKKWGRFDITQDRNKAEIILVLSTGETDSVTTEVKFIDAINGESLYSDSRSWYGFHSATREVLRGLRKRIEEQEKRK